MMKNILFIFGLFLLRDGYAHALQPLVDCLDNAVPPSLKTTMSELYLEGREGTPKNTTAALECLHNAAMTHNPKALEKLGRIYLSSDVVPVDKEKALEYLTQAYAIDPKEDTYFLIAQLKFGPTERK